MDTPIIDRCSRAVGEAQAVTPHNRQRRALPTSGADQVPARRQARLHRAMTGKGAGVVGLIEAGGAL
jgi:hypothetical protein